MLLKWCETDTTLFAEGCSTPEQTEYVFETTVEMDEELHRALVQWATAGRCGDWRWKREPWVPPARPEKLRGLRQYADAKVIPTPPGGVLWLKCARRFKKGARSEPS